MPDGQTLLSPRVALTQAFALAWTEHEALTGSPPEAHDTRYWGRIFFHIFGEMPLETEDRNLSPEACARGDADPRWNVLIFEMDALRAEDAFRTWTLKIKQKIASLP
jgi:hypothetical protein